MRVTFDIDRRTLVRAGIVVGVAAVLGGGFALARNLLPARSSGRPPGSSPAPTGPASSPATGIKGFTTFVDKEGGWGLAFPSTWTRHQDNETREIRLVAGPGSGSFVLVKLQLLTQPTAPGDVPGLEGQLDQIVQEPGVTVVSKRQVTTENGLPGWYFSYVFPDSETGAEVVHAHYFLFDGQKFFQMIFRASPTAEFARMAPTFAQVADTFRSLVPESPSPSPSK